MSFEVLRGVALFDGLTDTQLSELLAAGEEVAFRPGDELFREGSPADDWWVLLAGSVSLLRHVGHEESLLQVMDSAGQWAGGFRAWDPHGVYLATGRAVTDGRALRVPAQRLRGLADAWFPFGVHLIQGLVGTVRRIESVARQREALVALGTLAAGLAHELNNPASAATRAVDALDDTTAELLTALGRLAAGSISAEQFAGLDALRREAVPGGRAADPLGLADREDAISDWLQDRGVERPWLLSGPLAAAGLDTDWCDRAAAVLGDGPLEAGLQWVASSLSTSALLAEVKDATHRISSLVSAVRSYSQLDRASLQKTDVREGLESTLVMLSHRLEGITVVRELVDVPPIDAYAGELNQVWTNVIDNAVDAMKGGGTLRVALRPDGDAVVVEIADSGAGMSAYVLAHAFEPFFTTKDVGEGTGLGLDIARRIVAERHGGDISFDSRPGETVLRVRLPVRRQKS